MIMRTTFYFLLSTTNPVTPSFPTTGGPGAAARRQAARSGEGAIGWLIHGRRANATARVSKPTTPIAPDPTPVYDAGARTTAPRYFAASARARPPATMAHWRHNQTGEPAEPVLIPPGNLPPRS